MSGCGAAATGAHIKRLHRAGVGAVAGLEPGLRSGRTRSQRLNAPIAQFGRLTRGSPVQHAGTPPGRRPERRRRRSHPANHLVTGERTATTRGREVRTTTSGERERSLRRSLRASLHALQLASRGRDPWGRQTHAEGPHQAGRFDPTARARVPVRRRRVEDEAIRPCTAVPSRPSSDRRFGNRSEHPLTSHTARSANDAMSVSIQRPSRAETATGLPTARRSGRSEYESA